MALWHGAQTLSNVLGGPFAAGVLTTMEGKGGMHAWEWCRSILLISKRTLTLYSHAHRGSTVYHRRHIGILLVAQLGREHSLVDSGRDRDGSIPTLPIQRRSR